VEGFFPLKREPLILAALFLLSNPSSFILNSEQFFLTCAPQNTPDTRMQLNRRQSNSFGLFG
jgi:hypothetical protein